MDTKGNSAEISYPNIFFILDNFEEVSAFCTFWLVNPGRGCGFKKTPVLHMYLQYCSFLSFPLLPYIASSLGLIENPFIWKNFMTFDRL